MDDCINLILQNVCRAKVYDLATPLVGKSGLGEFSYDNDKKLPKTELYNLSPIMKCSGFKRNRETILLADTVVPVRKKKRDAELVRQTDLSVTTGNEQSYTLLVKDLYSHDSVFYEEEEFQFNPPLASHVCVAYGRRERRTYSLCLNKTLKVAVEVDVEIVPTSWWHPDDAEGTHWVLQITTPKDRGKKVLQITSDETKNISDRVILAGWS